MVQIAVKSLTREGLNTSIDLVLRDCRHQSFSDSILGTIQAGLNNGPIYFQCFPNLTTSLEDKDILDSLILMVKTHNLETKNSPVIIVSRIYYKAMTSYSSISFTLPYEVRSSSSKSKVTNNTHMSPTHSQVQNQYINTLRTDFTINKELLREDFYSSPNKSKRDWFFQKFPCQERNVIQEKYYEFLRKYQVHTKFFMWFECYAKNNSIFYPNFEEPNQEVIESSVQTVVEPFVQTIIPTIGILDQIIESDSEVEEIVQTFKNSPSQDINKVIWPTKPFPNRNYYSRPTFPDMQIEERGQFTQASYHSETLYEWNIDGRTEYQILNLLQEMPMVSTTYKSRQDASDHSVAQALVAGFTGQLKGWWDHYLTQDERNSILQAYRMDTSGFIIKTEEGEDMEDAVATLIFAIAKHFIGDPSQVKDKTSDLLTNLKCPKLQDFRWYKDVFLTKVMMRTDCNQAFWKEKFISGLPTLFSEKIRTKIREQNKGSIPYDKLTYGEIINTITAEGIALCNDFKLKQQLKNEQVTSKNEFGSFCSQFGFDTIKLPPSKQYKKTPYHLKKPRRNFQSKDSYYEKPFPNKYKSKRPFRKTNTRDNRNKAEFRKETTCYKCGKVGHYMKDCRVKQKINELDVSEDLKIKLQNLLLNSEQSSEEENQINEIETSSNQDSSSGSSESDQEIRKNCECHKKGKTINMLSKEQEFIVDLIDKISDNEDKKYLFSKFKETLVKQKPQNTIESSYNLKDIFDRFQPTISKQVTIKDLQQEINQCKSDIQEIKIYIQEKISELQDQGFDLQSNKEQGEISNDQDNQTPESFLNIINQVVYQRWMVKITIIIANEFIIESSALIDSGAALNCIKEGLVPTKYYQETRESLYTASGSKLRIKHKLQDTIIKNQDVRIKQSFVIVQDLQEDIILGIPFLNLIYPISQIDEKGIRTTLVGQEIIFEFNTLPDSKVLGTAKDLSIFQENTLNMIIKKNCHINFSNQDVKKESVQTLQTQIANFKRMLEQELCHEFSNKFWYNNDYRVQLTHWPKFNQEKIPHQSNHIVDQKELRQEIKQLLDKRLIRESKSPWNNMAFYKKKKGKENPKFCISYKKLNKTLLGVLYSQPNKYTILQKLQSAKIYSKFKIKSEFWQVQIQEPDKHKTAFTVPFGKYEWNIMPIGLKDAQLEFQDILIKMLASYQEFCIVHMTNVLIFSLSTEQHWNHIQTFIKITEENGIALDLSKTNLFQTKINFLGYSIQQRPIPIYLTSQDSHYRVLGSLESISYFHKEIETIYLALQKRIQEKGYNQQQRSFYLELSDKQIHVKFNELFESEWRYPSYNTSREYLEIYIYISAHQESLAELEAQSTITLSLFRIGVSSTEFSPKSLTFKFLQEIKQMDKQDRKRKQKFDYPVKNFMYGNGSSPIILPSVYQSKFSFSGDISGLSEKTVVVLDNLKSSFVRNHPEHFNKAIRAAAQHFQILELDSMSKFLQESNFLRETEFEPEKITNPKVTGLLENARSLAWQKFSTLPPEIWQEISARMAQDCNNWLDIYQDIENNTNESLAAKRLHWSKNCVIHDTMPHKIVFCKSPDPQIVATLFEGGFLGELQIINKHQISLLPQILKQAINDYMDKGLPDGRHCFLEIDSANPDWEKDYSKIYPSVHLVRITSWSSTWYQENQFPGPKEKSMTALRKRRLEGLEKIATNLRQWSWHVVNQTSRITVQLSRPPTHPWIQKIEEGRWESSKEMQPFTWFHDTQKKFEEKYSVHQITEADSDDWPRGWSSNWTDN